MRHTAHLVCIGLFMSLTAFGANAACDYAGSNLDFVRTETELALQAEDINISRYHAYKALNAIVKSEKQMEDCGCDYAMKSIADSYSELKKATRVSSLNGAKIFLKRALESTLGSKEAITKHDELHVSLYASDVLAMNTKTAEASRLGIKLPSDKILHQRIDRALVNFSNSLDEVVRTVDCEEALEFATRIYQHCEKELFREDLTPAKKYYNYKTKEITKKALRKLESCSKGPKA